jgi:hypothetical protein
LEWELDCVELGDTDVLTEEEEEDERVSVSLEDDVCDHIGDKLEDKDPDALGVADGLKVPVAVADCDRDCVLVSVRLAICDIDCVGVDVGVWPVLTDWEAVTLSLQDGLADCDMEAVAERLVDELGESVCVMDCDREAVCSWLFDWLTLGVEERLGDADVLADPELVGDSLGEDEPLRVVCWLGDPDPLEVSLGEGVPLCVAVWLADGDPDPDPDADGVPDALGVADGLEDKGRLDEDVAVIDGVALCVRLAESDVLAVRDCEDDVDTDALCDALRVVACVTDWLGACDCEDESDCDAVRVEMREVDSEEVVLCDGEIDRDIDTDDDADGEGVVETLADKDWLRDAVALGVLLRLTARVEDCVGLEDWDRVPEREVVCDWDEVEVSDWLLVCVAVWLDVKVWVRLEVIVCVMLGDCVWLAVLVCVGVMTEAMTLMPRYWFAEVDSTEAVAPVVVPMR